MVAKRLHSERGPGRWGLRLRGLAVAVTLIVVAAVAWRSVQPDRHGHTSFGLIVANIGDGVSAGTTIRLHGLPVGSVSDLQARGPDRQLVTLSVDAARMRELSTTLQARFASANVFGTTVLELVPMPGGSPLSAGAVLDMGDQVGNYTITKILRDSGRAVLDVVTSKLAVSVDGVAELTAQTTPLLASALLAMRTLQRTQNMPLRELLPKVGDVSEGIAAFTPPAVGILDSLASVQALDDPRQVTLAHDTIVEVSNLVFSFAGKMVGALGPLSSVMDMLLDLLIPLNQGLRNVDPHQVHQLIAGLDGALHRDGDRVDLDTEVLLQGFPAFAVPLQTTGAQPR